MLARSLAFTSGVFLVALNVTSTWIFGHHFEDFRNLNLHLWGGAVGMLLIAVLAGLFLGERLGRRWPGYTLVFALALAAGVTSAPVSFFTEPVCNLIGDLGVDSRFAPIIAYVMLLFIPSLAILMMPVVLAHVGAAGNRPALRTTAAFFILGMVAGLFGFIILRPYLDPMTIFTVVTVGLLVVPFLGLGIRMRFGVTLVIIAYSSANAYCFVDITPAHLKKVLREEIKAREVKQKERMEVFRTDAPYLTVDQIRPKFKHVRDKLVEEEDKSNCIALVFEALYSFGRARLTGKNLRDAIWQVVHKQYTRDNLEPFLGVIKELYADVSDGEGKIWFFLNRRPGSAAAIVLTVPNRDGSTTDLLFKSDFYLNITTEGETTTIIIGPRRKEFGGWLSGEFAWDTPVAALDVLGPFDATLVEFFIHNRPEEVVVGVRAQGCVGGVKTRVLDRIKK